MPNQNKILSNYTSIDRISFKNIKETDNNYEESKSNVRLIKPINIRRLSLKK